MNILFTYYIKASTSKDFVNFLHDKFTFKWLLIEAIELKLRPQTQVPSVNFLYTDEQNKSYKILDIR